MKDLLQQIASEKVEEKYCSLSVEYLRAVSDLAAIKFGIKCLLSELEDNAKYSKVEADLRDIIDIIGDRV